MTNPQGAISTPDPLAGGLRRVLANLLALQLQAKQAQWTTTGPDGALHHDLGQVAANTIALADRVAGRIRQLGGIPDWRAPTIVATADLTPYPLAEHTPAAAAELVAARLTTVSGAVRAVGEGVPAEDSTTAELLGHIVETLDKDARMVGAEAGTNG